MAAGGGRVNPVPLAFQGVKFGLSAREGLIAARQAGVQIRDATWFKIYGQAKNALALQVTESSISLSRKPMGGEIANMDTKNAGGFIQYVEVYVRDRATGVVSTRPFAVRGNDLITRDQAVMKALTRFEPETSPDGNYGHQTVIGAAYTATYQLNPTG